MRNIVDRITCTCTYLMACVYNVHVVTQHLRQVLPTFMSVSVVLYTFNMPDKML